MSKLCIKDLERIKNGKIVRFNENTKEKYSSFISLANINEEIKELRRIRFSLLRQFRDDVNLELEKDRGCRIGYEENITFNPESLFSSKYLSFIISTILGDTVCLFDENGLVGVSNESSRELLKKCELIIPYIKALFAVIKKSKVIDNSFYEEYHVYDSDNDVVLNINGNGVLLPFKEYDELDNIDVQKLLGYYYSNLEDILKNILIPNTESLEPYRRDLEPEKILNLYKGER